MAGRCSDTLWGGLPLCGDASRYKDSRPARHPDRGEGAERKLVIITEPEALRSGPGHYDARGDVGYKHTPSNLQIQLIAMAAQSGQTNTLVPSVIILPM
jgi:hypothetical protein